MTQTASLCDVRGRGAAETRGDSAAGGRGRPAGGRAAADAGKLRKAWGRCSKWLDPPLKRHAKIKKMVFFDFFRIEPLPANKQFVLFQGRPSLKNRKGKTKERRDGFPVGFRL